MRGNTPSLRKLKREVANPTRYQKQSMHVSWWRMSPQDNVWNHLCRKIMNIASPAKGKIDDPLKFGSHVYSCASSDEDPDAKAAAKKEWKKLETIPAWQMEKVKNKKKFTLEAQREKRKSTLLHRWTLVISKMRS